MTSGQDFKENAMTTPRDAMPALALALAIVALAAIPASADEPTTAVSGMVTFRGKPLGTGRILFHLEDDEFVGGKVKDGAFRLTRVPAGAWRVTIEAEGMPAKFSSDEVGVLKAEVKMGTNRFDFNLRYEVTGSRYGSGATSP